MRQAVLAYNPVMRCASPDNMNGTIGPSAWASEWRQRYFRRVGTVHPRGTGELVLCFGDARADEARTLMQEMSDRLGGVADVAAACGAALVAQFGWDVAA